jgi:EAL domain-containing protein (putative c-di-GMP-specific phosphodiesterase class I)
VVFDETFAAFANQPAYQFSINISFEDIADDEIAAYIKEKICAFPDPERIILEITESEQIENQEKINKFIHEVKTVGVKIAIDDFGSGYSNFDHILTLSADYIKIDGTLIKNITESEESRIITEAIIAFSKKLGAKTVVEFVHNEAVYEMVRQMGADFAQGYFLGEPNPYLRKTKRSEEKQEAEGTA